MPCGFCCDCRLSPSGSAARATRVESAANCKRWISKLAFKAAFSGALLQARFGLRQIESLHRRRETIQLAIKELQRSTAGHIVVWQCDKCCGETFGKGATLGELASQMSCRDFRIGGHARAKASDGNALRQPIDQE